MLLTIHCNPLRLWEAFRGAFRGEKIGNKIYNLPLRGVFPGKIERAGKKN